MAQRAFIKKGDLIFVLAFLAFVAGVLWYRQTQPPVEGNWAVVTVDSQEVAAMNCPPTRRATWWTSPPMG